MSHVSGAAEASHSGTPEAVSARIERLPGVPLGTLARVLLAALYFFAFFDITVIGVVLPTVAEQFHLKESQLNLPVTLNLVGYVAGALAFSTFADRFGRRRALFVTMTTLAVGALLCSFSWDIYSLSVFRGIVGLGIGALIAIGATYTAELVPGRLRGRVTQFNLLLSGFGLGGAPWIARPLLAGGPTGWRILVGLGAIAIVGAGLVRVLPESPHWLARQGRTAEADAVTTQLEAHFAGKHGELELPPIDPGALAPEAPRLPALDLARPPYVGRLVVVLGFWVLLYFASYSVLGYEPILLSHLGLSTPDSTLFTAIGDSAFPVGAALTYFFVDRIDRRITLIIWSGVFTLAILLFAIGSSTAIITIAAVLFALSVVPQAAAGYTYTSEIFPTNARATAMAMGDGVGHMGGVFAGTITLAALASWGGRGTFWLLTGFAFASLLFIAIGGKRATTGRSILELEEDQQAVAATAGTSRAAAPS